MHWQSTPYTLPLLIAATVTASLAAYAWRRRSAPGAMPFSLLMVAVTIWSLGYTLELAGAELPVKVFWAKVQYVGIVSVPTAWLAFALQYTNREGWLSRRNLALLAIAPSLILLLAWTNEQHSLIWSSVRLDSSGSFSTLDISYGPGLWGHAVYSYLVLLLGTLLIAGAFLRSPHVYRGQTGTLLLGALAPWVGNAVYLAGLSPFPHLDLTPLAFTLAGLLLAWDLFHYRLLDIVPIARDIVIESMSDGVIVLDAQGRIVDFNPAAQALVGRPPVQMIGRPAAQVLADQTDLVERYKDASQAHAEILIGEEAGQRCYDLRISPLYERRGALVGRLLVLRDITRLKELDRMKSQAASENARLYAEVRAAKDSLEQRVAERTRELAQSEAALRQRNQELAALNAIASITSQALDLDEVLDWVLEQAIQVFEPAQEGAIFVLADAGRELRLRAHRGLPPQTLQQMLSISPDKGPYRKVVETGQPFSTANAKQDAFCSCPLETDGKGYILVPLKTEESVHGVLTLYLPATYQLDQDDQRLLIAIGHQIGMAIERAALFSRITAMNRTLEQQVVERTLELHREKERLDTILRHVPDGIMFTDAQATILYVNPGFEKITGYTARQALGRNAKFLGSDQTPLNIYQDLRQALTDGAMWQGELVNRHRDGRLYDAHLIISPIQDRQGNLVNMVGSLRDITRLKELDRMKSQFVSTVSHELRTPVAAIKLHIENLLEFFDRMSPDQRHSFLADIQTQAETLAQLIEDILNLSRLEAGPPQPQLQSIEFVALLQEILDQMAPLAENAGVSLHLLDAASHIVLEADGGQLKDVLRNLIGNAIKFTPGGGQVTCRAQAENGHLVLSVSDTGMGIPAEDLPHIFERFYRGTQVASQQIPGTGLGLTIVKQIVDGHGGTVTVESVPGEGATFTVRLPHAETHQSPVLSPPSRSPKKIEQELAL
jgi:PAS domain S-box-containing protein